MRLARWFFLAAFLSVFTTHPARASGPVERLLQLLVHPSQPELLVVRYGAGAGSHGYLFSRDGGRSFRLACSANVSPNPANTLAVQRISTRPIPATAATLVDQRGAVMFAQYGATWLDDATGCTWGEVPELHDKWPLSLKLDPRDPALVWSVVNTAAAAGSGQRSRFELMRRAAGGWTNLGSIREVDLDKAVIDATLAVHADAGARRLYASVLMMGARGVSAGYLLRSDDDGTSWTEHALPKEQERLNLLAVDPTHPDRVLAAISRDGAADTLLLSSDGGASFASYFEPRAVGGVTFDETGRVFVADIGDGAELEVDGGLFTAARLGEPLVKVPNTAGVDCVVYQPRGRRLFVCHGDRFGVLDPRTGALDELLRLDQVTDFIACPGKDLHAICQNQLNSGPSWCCAGHYPFTPLCGEYDVTTRPDNGRVFCGLSGREYDRPADAGTAPEPEPQRAAPEGGASCERGLSLSVLCIAASLAFLLHRRRKRP
jgi:hypothetical protein